VPSAKLRRTTEKIMSNWSPEPHELAYNHGSDDKELADVNEQFANDLQNALSGPGPEPAFRADEHTIHVVLGDMDAPQMEIICRQESHKPFCPMQTTYEYAGWDGFRIPGQDQVIIGSFTADLVREGCDEDAEDWIDFKEKLHV
jgi:hypothetical protein